MRVAFVLPGLSLSGGVRVVLELADRLRPLGFKTCVVDAQGLWGNPLPQGDVWSGCHPPRIPTCVPVSCPVYSEVPGDADVVFATSWDVTVHLALHHERSGRGRAAWFVQNWEAGWTPGHITWDPGISNVVCVSQWLADSLKSKWGRESRVLHYGLGNLSGCAFTRREKVGIPRALLCYRDSPGKAPIKTLDLAYDLLAEGWHFTVVSPEPLPSHRYPGSGLHELAPHWVTGVGPEEMPDLYSSHEFFFLCSEREGLTAMPVEAMARGCVPIVSDSGTEHVTPQVGMRLLQTARSVDYIAAAEAVWPVWSDYSGAGLALARRFTWESQAPRWAAAIREIGGTNAL